MAGKISSRIVTDGLSLYLDFSNPKSYIPGSSAVYNLKNQDKSTISGTFSYNSSLYTSPVLEINNNGTSSNGQIQVLCEDLNTLALSNNFTVMFAAKRNFYGIGGNNIGNSQIFQGVHNGYNSGWRIVYPIQGTPGDSSLTRSSINFGFNDIRTVLNVYDPVSFNLNRMAICAFTVSPSNIFGFLNGLTSSISNPNNYVGGTSTPRISFAGAGVGSFNGLIGFFMIYRRALTYQEILQNYNSTKGRYGL